MANFNPSASTDLPSADDIAYRIMNDQVSDYDYTEWASDELQAQAFQKVVGIIASYKWSKALTLLENRSERLTNIEHSINKILEAWAKRKGFPE